MNRNKQTQRRERIRKVVEALIRTSGYVSSAVVVLIVIFLFREGTGLFFSKPIEDEYIVAVHPSNPIDELDGETIRQLHEKQITNWGELTDFQEEVFLFNLGNIDDYVTEQELGENFSLLPEVVSRYIEKERGILLVFPKSYLPEGAKLVELKNISLGTFVAGQNWYPTASPSPEFGALPLILGTFWVTLGAILLALPLGLAVAIYLAELSTDRLRDFLKPAIELLAGIPSVVYGFFGLVVVVPEIQQLFGVDVGETALAGSIMLAIIALPTIITVSEDALKACPRSLKEASLALGATKWETITRVVVPYGLSGVTAATILGVGRAVGETMTVLMVTGNAAVLPSSFLEPIRTLSATIAAELGEAPQGGLHYKALFMVGCVLFVITFSFNLLAEFIANKRKLKDR